MVITQLFLSFHPSDFQALTSRMLSLRSLPGWLQISLSLNSSKTEFLLIGIKRQLAKINNPLTWIDTARSARNHGFIFDERFSFSDQISTLTKSCYHHIRASRCIRPYLDFYTAKKIATSNVHSKLDYCNSLYYGFPKYQINRLQHIQNALARTVVQAPKFQHIIIFWNLICTGLKFLYELNHALSFTKLSIPLSHCNSMTLYLFSLLMVTTHVLHLTSLWSNHHHRTNSLIASSPHLWNQLPTSLRIPHPNYSSPLSDLHFNMPV